MQFSEVHGQKMVKQRLIRSVRDNRVSHAQLFFGPEGTGKLPLAIAYAQYMCCEDPGADDSCGRCPSCIKYRKLAHPDLHFVFPVVNIKQGGSNTVSDHFITGWREALADNPYITENQWYEVMGAENKQGFISRNESNEVLRKLSFKSYEAPYKVLIIWLAEKMNAQAANALLKLLEEPPDKTVFLLVSEHTDLILPTILSRMQTVMIPPLDEASIRSGLFKRFPGQQEMAEDVIRRSNGNYSLAIQLMESGEMEQEHFEEFVLLMRMCYGREIVEIRQWTERIAGWGRERLKMFLAYGLRMIRENFMLNLQQKELTYMSAKEEEFSVRFSPFIHTGNVFTMVEEFDRAIEHIEANGYAKLILLDLAIRNILLLKQPAPVD
ncbi:MAG: DNA polymerase III subunit delta [Bacteroidales bacterium]|nr:DNA polymerase III subunit delta [Bacteroidales bacterium]